MAEQCTHPNVYVVVCVSHLKCVSFETYVISLVFVSHLKCVSFETYVISLVLSHYYWHNFFLRNPMLNKSHA